jgi:hypothetical protein
MCAGVSRGFENCGCVPGWRGYRYLREGLRMRRLSSALLRTFNVS